MISEDLLFIVALGLTAMAVASAVAARLEVRRGRPNAAMAALTVGDVSAIAAGIVLIVAGESALIDAAGVVMVIFSVAFMASRSAYLTGYRRGRLELATELYAIHAERGYQAAADSLLTVIDAEGRATNANDPARVDR